jgi:hypothetical protein
MQYPAIGHHGGAGITYPGKRLPSEPTTYPPGSPQKIQVMAERAFLGEFLYHPGDATLDGWSHLTLKRLEAALEVGPVEEDDDEDDSDVDLGGI